MKLRKIATRNEIITLMAQRRARRSPVNGVATCTGESMVILSGRKDGTQVHGLHWVLAL